MTFYDFYCHLYRHFNSSSFYYGILGNFEELLATVFLNNRSFCLHNTRKSYYQKRMPIKAKSTDSTLMAGSVLFVIQLIHI